MANSPISVKGILTKYAQDPQISPNLCKFSSIKTVWQIYG